MFNKQSFLRKLHKKIKDLDIPRSSRYEKALIIIGRVSYPLKDDDETWLLVFQILCKLSINILFNTSQILESMYNKGYSYLEVFNYLIVPLLWKAFGNTTAIKSLVSEYKYPPYKLWLRQIAAQVV